MKIKVSYSKSNHPNGGGVDKVVFYTVEGVQGRKDGPVEVWFDGWTPWGGENYFASQNRNYKNDY